ncbi:retron St85 family RNA-directed DNA polymerase [Pseudoduganella aquatica]|uniref:retron St85 family RNA-directed DNA polymerase n=1 Tax=Pseudoduganella aquatica TaxID=2660641 RepID=UPI001E434A3E|nr:retron St85 family RNA-directed DNA polymerase [Pseudoduganella aquatica]
MNFLQHMCDKLFMSQDELINFARTMPYRYKKYRVGKRNGSGYRIIAQPSSEAKFIQRILLKELRRLLPVHECAMAYEPGVGIRKNAMRHLHSDYLLKMDFKDFFPSITPDLFFFFTKKIGLELGEKDKELLENVIFWKSTRSSYLKLSIGAPTSPFISNFVMHEFDKSMNQFCISKAITYTRYADDLTFTSNAKNILFEIPSLVSGHLKKDCLGLIKVNTKKTVFSSKAFNRHVTGIVLANDNSLSLGREQKRTLSSIIHRFSLGKLSEKETSRLKGHLSFAHHIEPKFIDRMKKKYGNDLIDLIFLHSCE